MTIADNLRALADFHEAHPNLPAPHVTYHAAYSWEDPTPAEQLGQFVDGTDEIAGYVTSRTSPRAIISRDLCGLRASLHVDRELVVLAPAPFPLFATAAQVRERGAA